MNKQTLIIISMILLGLSNPLHAANKALLIGVGEYQGDKDDLEGPKHDVSALKATLQKHWSFKPENIKTLVDSDATHDNILKALTQLKENIQPQDQIFIYFSGHGTSLHDKALGLPLPYSSGALIPHDFSKTGNSQQMVSQLIVGQRDLKPILTEIDKTQAQTFVVFDSCYSGNSVRGLYAGASLLRNRHMSLNLPASRGFDDYEDDEVSAYNSGKQQKAEPYPYRNIFFLSAANAREVAQDIGTLSLKQFPTLDNKPHGAFTDSLLRALSGELDVDGNNDGQLSYSELYASISGFMKEKGYSHAPQVLPQLSEDNQMLRMRNVLGKQNVSTPRQKPQSAFLNVHVDFSDPALLNQLRKLPHVQISDVLAELSLKKKANDYLLINKAGDLIGTLTNPSIQQTVGRIGQEAWKKQFRQQLQKSASINIDFSLKDGIKGSTAIEGELIAFALRSEKPVHLLLLDVDANGTLTVLYPYRTHELSSIKANQLKVIPGENPNDWIKVQSPFGTDHLIAIGFSEEPAFLKEFVGKNSLILQSDLYQKLKQHLQKATFGYKEFDLLTVPANNRR
ncbi:MAG: caspase family protein [Methylococcales bacterium]